MNWKWNYWVWVIGVVAGLSMGLLTWWASGSYLTGFVVDVVTAAFTVALLMESE